MIMTTTGTTHHTTPTLRTQISGTRRRTERNHSEHHHRNQKSNSNEGERRIGHTATRSVVLCRNAPCRAVLLTVKH